MAQHTLEVPDLGETAGSKATVTYWHRAEGDRVNVDEDIVEVTYDKATFYVPSPVDGVLKRILAQEDATVPVGGALAIIETESE